MGPMVYAPEQERSPVPRPAERSARFGWLHTFGASSTRRALLLTALGGLLIAGVITAIPMGDGAPGRLSGYINPVPSTGSKGNDALNHASSGNCLMWPERMVEAATVVDCKDEHRFEVAESIDMSTFPGSEYGRHAAPPSAARIEQITQEQCETAVRRYLGSRFDPSSRFISGMLWSGDRAWRQWGDRRVLCGLELPGAADQQITFKGKVADIDQSKVWPAGTCLGIDPTSNQPADVPVDCAAPHAMEVTGSVNLAEKFSGGLPAEPDQDGFIKDYCTRLTDAYLAPVQLRSTTLTLTYDTISLPSWSAGSREVACRIGATLGNGGWATLLNSAKGALLINGQPPISPPDIPPERLAVPPIELPTNAPSVPSAPSAPSAGTSTQPSQQGNQHLPNQPGAPAGTQPPAPAAPPPAAAPPPPAADQPPPGAEPPPPGLPPAPEAPPPGG